MLDRRCQYQPVDRSRSVNIRQLEYAVAVRERGSMSDAAEACHISQPSLSQGIRKLEEQLGVELFERHPAGTRPTRAGDALLDQAETILAEVRRLDEMASATASGPLEGTLRLGVIRTVAPYLLPEILLPLERAYPELELEVVEGLTDDLLAQLDDCRLDAALIALPWPIPESLAVYEAYREEFFALLPEGDPLADEDQIRLHELDPGELLLLEEGHCLRDHALQVCEFPESALRRTLRAASLETIRQFVAAGWGVSLFPATALSADDALVIRPPVEEAYRDIVAVTRGSFPRRDSIAALAEFLADTVGELAAGDHLSRAPEG